MTILRAEDATLERRQLGLGPLSAHTPLWAVTLALVAGVFGASCAVHFVSAYDSILDERVAALSERTEVFLAEATATAGTPDGSYEKSKGFYRAAAASVAALSARASADDHGELVVRQLADLSASFEALRQLHEGRGDAGLSEVLVKPARDALRVQFRSIAKLQAELRRSGEAHGS